MIIVLREDQLIEIKDTDMKQSDIFYNFVKKDALLKPKFDIKPKIDDLTNENNSDEVSIEELKIKLKNSDIKFFAWAKYEVLYQKCLDNNLL